MIVGAQSQNIVIEKRSEGFSMVKLSLTFNMTLKRIE